MPRQELMAFTDVRGREWSINRYTTGNRRVDLDGHATVKVNGASYSEKDGGRYSVYFELYGNTVTHAQVDNEALAQRIVSTLD